MITRGHVRNGVVVLQKGIHLPEGQKVTVIAQTKDHGNSKTPHPALHGLLEIPPVSLGPALPAPTDDDDVLGEMLEGRPCFMALIPAFSSPPT